MLKAKFQKRTYDVIFTDHSLEQMKLRGLSQEDVIRVIERGTVKQRKEKHRFWVYMNFPTRSDNLVCISVAIEPPHLIVITTLVNWSPK